MRFTFPKEQRVLTPEEYAALGYVQIGDLSNLDIAIKNDTPLSISSPFPVYRADTKEEFAYDIAIGIGKITAAAATGGTAAVIRTTLGYVTSLLT